jgi:hypothetical protein
MRTIKEIYLECTDDAMHYAQNVSVPPGSFPVSAAYDEDSGRVVVFVEVMTEYGDIAEHITRFMKISDTVFRVVESLVPVTKDYAYVATVLDTHRNKRVHVYRYTGV